MWVTMKRTCPPGQTLRSVVPYVASVSQQKLVRTSLMRLDLVVIEAMNRGLKLITQGHSETAQLASASG